MSLSLISRQLNTLKLAQRAVMPRFVSANSRAAPVAVLHIAATPSQFAPAVQLMQLPAIQLGISRTFSSMNQATTNDDGGPVTGSNFKDMSNSQLADMSTIPGWGLVHNPPRRNPRGALVGKVVSDKMNKTVNVAVDRYKMIPKYRKRWTFTRKFMAHDEHEVCNVGDLVMIVPCQRISRHKHFMVREIIRGKGQL